MPLSRRVLALSAAASALLLGACSSGGSHGASSPTPSGAPATRLAELAAKGLQTSYTATYTLTGTTPATAASVAIRRTPAAYRVDIRTSGSTAILVHNAAGTYSCEQKPAKPATCFLVARAGKPIPAPFDAGVQKVFNTYLTVFSQPLTAYAVDAVAPVPAADPLPEARCFHVAPIASPAPASAVADGTYCFSNNGIPVHVAFASGTLDMRSLAVETPAPPLLVPPARPTPLPGV